MLRLKKFMNIEKATYIEKKKIKRENKQKYKRKITAEEVIFIFEKILEGWKTIRIYNTLIQQNPSSEITKSQVEQIATGNCKIYENELTTERYDHYLVLRNKIYNK
jgi:hypothetical protein